jgi:hypothetical protein
MPSVRVALPFVAVFGGCIASAAPALAHIDLRSPAPRVHGFPDTTLSRGPCGQRSNVRGTDSVTVFRPGQTIDVVWDVYVQHVSYFRVAFDADGDDSFSSRSSTPDDPAADDPTIFAAGDGETILAYVEDHTGDVDHVEQRVTLPDIECDNCTLQLIQFTYGLPLRDATYYQCADLVLDAVAPGGQAGALTLDAGNASPTVGALAPTDDDAGGCALRTPGGRAAPGALASLSVLLAAALRRRRYLGRRHAQRSASDSIDGPSSST